MGADLREPRIRTWRARVIPLGSKAISEIEAATPLTCESFHRGELKKERAVCTQYPGTIQYASLATPTANCKYLQETWVRHTANTWAMAMQLDFVSGTIQGSSWRVNPGSSEKTRSCVHYALWLQHGIKAQVSEEHIGKNRKCQSTSSLKPDRMK